MKDKEPIVFSKLNLILYFIKGCKKYFAYGILFACLLVFFDLINPKIIQYSVDYVIKDDASSVPAWIGGVLDDLGGRSYFLAHLWIVAFAVIVFALFGAVFRYLTTLLNAMGAERLMKRMRDCLYEQIMHLPYAWQDENSTGDIIQRCTSDVDTIKNFLSEQLTSLFRILLMIFFALYYMIELHGLLALIAALFIPVVVSYSCIFHGKIGAAFQKIDEEEGRLSAVAQENLTGVRVVRAFGREGFEKDRFIKRNESYTGLWVDMMKLLSKFWASNDLLYGIETVTIVSAGAYFCVRGELTAGAYISFCAYNEMLIWPVRRIGRMISEMSKASISISRLQYIMNAKRETDAQDAQDFPEDFSIRFEDVSFSFGEDDKEKPHVLRHVNWEIKKGSTVGILGATGSGKSTLVHLLDRVYDLSDTEGRILIGGVDIRKIRRSDLRSNIGLILQEPFLFSRSIEDNIKIAQEEGGMPLEKAVRAAHLKRTLEKFADGYDTFVGERGVTLSGGQKQRTAIAQMFMQNAKIMVFDDSLSAVDSQTDRIIQENIKKYSKNATVILISHRISTLMHADEIIVLDKGRIIERGTHGKLLEEDGLYRRVYELQSRKDAAE